MKQTHKTKQRNVFFYMDEEPYTALKATATRLRRPVASVLRELIAKWLKHNYRPQA